MAFLNTYGNALFGRSFRLLDTGYSGPCCRLERTDTNAQTDINFSGGYFDEAAYLTWASGATEVRCIELYDQIGSQDLSIVAVFAPFVRKDGVDVRDAFGRINLGWLEFDYFGNIYTPYMRNSTGTDPFAGDRSVLFMISQLNFPTGVSRPNLYYWRKSSNGNTIAIQIRTTFSPPTATFRTIGTSSSFEFFTDSIYEENGNNYQAWNPNSLTDGSTTDHFIDETPPDGLSGAFSQFSLNEERVGWPSSIYKVSFIGSEFIVWDEKKSNTDINNASEDARAYWNTFTLPTDGISTAQNEVQDANIQVSYDAVPNDIENSQAVVSDAETIIVVTVGTLGAINNKAIVSNSDVATGAEAGTRVGLAKFSSLLGREWSIEIHDKDAIFAVSVPNFEVKSDGFTLDYESPNDEYLESIKGSKVSFTPIINKEDVTIQQLISEIGAAADGRFFVHIYEDSDLYWFGQIQTSLIREPDAWPSQVKITATDGLALLKDIDYAPTGNVSADGIPINLARFSEVIYECLEAIPTYTLFTSSDSILKVAATWYHSDMVSLDNCPLFTTAVRRYLFKKEDQRADSGFAPISCYDVLEEVLKAWNARIIMTNGQFLVEQVSSNVNTLRREWDFNAGGSTSSTVSSVNNTRTIDQTNVIRLAGGSRSWQKAAKSVSRIFEHNSFGNILENKADYTTLTDFNGDGLALSVGSAVQKTLKVRLPINLTVFNRTGSDLNLQGQYVALSLFIKLQGATDTIYLQKEIFADITTATWDTSSDSWFINMPLPGNVKNGEFRTIQKVVEFETPTFTNEDYVTQQIRISFPVATQLYASNNPSSVYTVGNLNFITYSDNQYDPAYSGDLLMWYQMGNSEIVLQGGDEQPSQEKEFESVNGSSDAVQVIDMPTTLIGTKFRSDLELGAVRVFDGSSFNVADGTWGYNTLTGTKEMTLLSVQENLRLYEETRSRQNFTIQGTLNANNTVSYKSDKYVFMGGKFVANIDRWSGEWVQIPTTVKLTGYTEILTTLGIPGSFNQGSGVTTLDDLSAQVSGIYENSKLTDITGGIDNGSDITEIDISDLGKSNVINQGDEITVISAATGQSQTFTVSSDVLSGDTTINVDLATTEFQILPGDIITISSVQLAEKSNSKVSEEGTFTPIAYLSSGTLNVVPSGTNGYYTVIGDLVFVRLRVQVDSVSSPFGDVFITNLPYNGDGTTNSFSSTIFNTISGDYVWGGFLVGNTIELYGLNTSQQASQDLQNATIITISGFYKKA